MGLLICIMQFIKMTSVELLNYIKQCINMTFIDLLIWMKQCIVLNSMELLIYMMRCIDMTASVKQCVDNLHGITDLHEAMHRPKSP